MDKHYSDPWEFWRDMTPPAETVADDPLADWLWNTCMAMRSQLNGYGHTRSGKSHAVFHQYQADMARDKFLGRD